MMVFTVDYNDGKVRAKAGDKVPDSIPGHRIGMMLKGGMVKKVEVPAPVAEKPATKRKLFAKP